MINISTKSHDWLGRALTNPSYAKNNKSEFDIDPNSFDEVLSNPITNLPYEDPSKFIPMIYRFNWIYKNRKELVTYQFIWGKSVEAWYFANTVGKNYKFIEKEKIIEHLIICKFKTYPNLIEEIDNRGGLYFLKSCSHIVSGNKNWEGKGEDSNFIRILINSYLIIKKKCGTQELLF